VTRQGTLASGFVRTHRKGASVTITDFAIIKKMLDLLDGSTDFDSSTPLKYDGDPTLTTDADIATKKYIDDIAIAGAADASTSTKGITTMSVAPASAATPIAVGDNDPRVPTADENNALVGTSGSPSTSNKFVTNDDTTGTGDIVRTSVLPNIILGDGSDGDVTVSASASIARDMYYDNLTIETGVVLTTAGFRIFVK